MPDTLDIMLPWHELRMRHGISNYALHKDPDTGEIILEEKPGGDIVKKFDTDADAVSYVQTLYEAIIS